MLNCSQDFYLTLAIHKQEFDFDFQPHLFQQGTTSQEILPLSIGDFAPLPHDLHTQHEAVAKLVLFEETTGHTDVGVDQDLVQQDLDALL